MEDNNRLLTEAVGGGQLQAVDIDCQWWAIRAVNSGCLFKKNTGCLQQLLIKGNYRLLTAAVGEGQ